MATKKKPTKSPTHSFETQLAALPAEASQQDPAIPAAVVILEATRMIAPARKARALFARLPRFDLAHVDHLPALVDFAESCERAWAVHRFSKTAGTGRVKARKEAEALRADLLGAGDYLFRKDARALAELARIREGEGLADLLQDLHDISQHHADHKATWALDSTLPDNVFTRIKELAAQLGSADENDEAVDAHERRNRAFVLLFTSVEEIRDAAAYVFRKHPAKLKPFPSTYITNKKRRSRGKEAPNPMP